MTKSITVLIPTYNRKEQLKKTMDTLEHQTCSDFSVVILDNASEYDLGIILDSLSDEFRNRIKVIKKPINTGGGMNGVEIFELCDSQWAWTLSDDEYIKDNAIETIYKWIGKLPNTGCFSFSIIDRLRFNEYGFLRMDSIDRFIDEYGNLKCYYHGDLIFVSNKVYNMSFVKSHLFHTFTYSYCAIPPVITIAKLLESRIPFVCVHERIVDYNMDSPISWDICTVVQATRILADIKYEISEHQRRQLLKIQAFDINMIYSLYFDNKWVKQNKPDFFDQIYHGLYKYFLNFGQRVKMRLFVMATKSNFGYHLIVWIKKTRGPIKNKLKTMLHRD